MEKKLKVYIITLAKTFQRPHPRTGEPTNFRERVLNGVGHQYKNDRGLIFLAKHHTGRENYDLWKKRCDEVNAGNAILSVRQWKGMPYRTGQIPIGLELTKVTIQKMDIRIFHGTSVNEGVFKFAEIFIDGLMLSSADRNRLIQSDGFDDPKDFMDWFGWKDWSGALIHFDEHFKY